MRRGEERLAVAEERVTAIELADGAVGGGEGLADEGDGGKGDGGDLDHFEGCWGVGGKLLEVVKRNGLLCWTVLEIVVVRYWD